MNRRSVFVAGLAALLAGCGQWQVDYDKALDPSVTRNWRLRNVVVTVPESLTTTEENSMAPDADIVWHGEPLGDRREQVGKILREAIIRGGSKLAGSEAVDILVELNHFHAVTPTAVSRAPGAVHNIRFTARVVDALTGQPLTEAEIIDADLEAFVGSAAAMAEVQGQGQRKRIVQHIASVTEGWLGTGPDQRVTFNGFGR